MKPNFICLIMLCLFLLSFFNVETEVDDLQVFNPPEYCDGVDLDKTTDDHSFFDLFHD